MTNPSSPPPSLRFLARDVAEIVDRLTRDLQRLSGDDHAGLFRMSEALAYQSDVLIGRLDLAERQVDPAVWAAPEVRQGFAAARADAELLAALGRRMGAPYHLG